MPSNKRINFVYEREHPNVHPLLRAMIISYKDQGGSKLSDKTGISRQNLNKIFSGRSIPRIDTFMSIAKGLGFQIRVEWITDDLK